MRPFFFFFISFLYLSGVVTAQSSADVKQPRILILLDESSSMINQWSPGKERYQVADEIILNLMDSIYKVNDQVEFSLRVFGHQHTVPENDCYDTRNEVMFSKNNYTQMALRLADIKPLGVTPIAYALQQAAENDLVNERDYSYSIILITDGGESCGGNICDVVKTLINRKIFFKPYIVSLVDYAPLKTEYACLGEYLQVTSQKEIPGTVGTIVQAYRPALTEAKTGIKQESVTKTVTAPVVVQVDHPKAPVPNPEPVKPVAVIPAPKPVIKDTTPRAPEPKHVINTNPEPPVIRQTIDAIAPDLEIHTFRQEYYAYPVSKITTPKLIVAKTPQDEKPVVNTVITKPVVPPKPAVKEPAPKPVVTKKPASSIQVVPEVKEKVVPFEKHVQDAMETTVEIYFTNGRGRFYSTAPQVIMLDPVTHKELQKFYRTVDVSGSPQPQKNIHPGTYDLTVNGKTNLLMHNVEIQEHKTNIITVKVSNGSLAFHYIDAPNRPISEFTAIVIQRDLPNGKTITQKCTSELEYEAGNYFIQVNTLPVIRRNIDIDFEAEYDMGIPQPGFLQITNTSKMGKAILYTPSGDKYAQFYSMNVSGIPESQKVQLQPGLYELRYKKNPTLPFATETVVPFRISATETTTIELEP